MLAQACTQLITAMFKFYYWIARSIVKYTQHLGILGLYQSFAEVFNITVIDLNWATLKTLNTAVSPAARYSLITIFAAICIAVWLLSYVLYKYEGFIVRTALGAALLYSAKGYGEFSLQIINEKSDTTMREVILMGLSLVSIVYICVRAYMKAKILRINPLTAGFRNMMPDFLFDSVDVSLYLVKVMKGAINGDMHKEKKGFVSGGIESVIVDGDRFYKSKEWKEMRLRVLTERQRICSNPECLNRGDIDAEGKLIIWHVDHILPRSKYPEYALEEENLRVLCSACNMRKGANYSLAEIDLLTQRLAAKKARVS